MSPDPSSLAGGLAHKSIVYWCKLFYPLKALCHDIRAIFSKLKLHVTYRTHLIEKQLSFQSTAVVLGSPLLPKNNGGAEK